MAKKLYEESSIQDIAAAIRAKNGEATTYKIGEMAAAIAAISGSPIVDNSLENTVQYRQMNATAAAFIANVDYTENANDYSVTKVTPYYSATTAYSKEEPDGLKIKVPANTALTVAQGGHDLWRRWRSRCAAAGVHCHKHPDRLHQQQCGNDRHGG